MNNNQTYRICILTDSNRNNFQMIMTDNILIAIQDIFSSNQNLCGNLQNLSRIVYEETFESEITANQRLQEFNNYTRMQRERLIRRKNPNWLNLYPIRPISNNLYITKSA